jgi:phosphopantothenoylcysteine decarboxylase/phosphopantothenate--cysteine ligase
VVGFAAETENVISNGQSKLSRKACDLIVANDVSPGTGVMGGLENSVHLITPGAVDSLPRQDKHAVAQAIIGKCIALMEGRRP